MFTFLILITNLFIILPNLEESEWKLSLDKDEITIYTRMVETSRFKEFKAKSKMRGSIEKFKEILMDIDKYPGWLPDCKSAKIVESPNGNDITYHLKLKVPFPFSNRDIVQQMLLNESEDKLEVTIHNRPNKVVKEEKYVRMPQAHGKWIVQKISEEELFVSFQYLADPGGDIPAWIVNTFIVKNPHLSLKNIREFMAE